MNLSKRVLNVLAMMSLVGCAGLSHKKTAVSSSETGRAAIHQMAGCFLVDYSYTETEPVKAGYRLDPRVYDVNKEKSVKEWIYAEDLSDDRIWVQHILFATDLKGNLIPGTELKHQAEDWHYNAPMVYQFIEPSKWQSSPPDSKLWTRKITSLDDGLRYQCAAAWRPDTFYSEWSCDNYAPIPGRETRDMHRKDYNTLQRSTRLIVYGDSWLERQNNTKILFKKGMKTPLAKEVGKNWYVRIADSECAVVHDFVKNKKAFWALTRDVWDGVLASGGSFTEHKPKGAPPRFAKMMEIEERFTGQDLSREDIRSQAKEQILKVINEYSSIQ